jgi:hypothetical protein
MAKEALGEIAGDLELIAERLAEAAMEVLRDAVEHAMDDDGFDDAGVAEAAKRLERRINRARAAVERAVHLLHSPEVALGGSNEQFE